VGVLGATSEGEDAPVKVERPKPSPTPKPHSSPASDPELSPTLTATPTPTPPPPIIRGFQYPIQGACLPAEDDLMPNAPR